MFLKFLFFIFLKKFKNILDPSTGGATAVPARPTSYILGFLFFFIWDFGKTKKIFSLELQNSTQVSVSLSVILEWTLKFLLLISMML